MSTLSATDWRRLKEVYAAALELLPEDRGPWLRETLTDDPALYDHALGLLLAAEDTRDPLREAIEGVGERLSERLGERREELALGKRLGPYLLESELGRGGMGQVFLARRDDAEYEHKVAIKVLRPALWSETLLVRFLAERQILARLLHPNIASLLDGGSTPSGSPYLVMEHVDGLPIDEYCRVHRLGLRQRLELLVVVIGAVEHAHRQLIVHRDLKPSNILVSAEGVPKLLDFGIAKLLAEPADPARRLETAVGEQLFTPEYASPEQLLGGPVSTVSDVYSLGVILFELLTGRRPFDDRGGLGNGQPAARAAARATAPPPRPSRVVSRAAPQASSPIPDLATGELRRRLIGELDSIVLTALRTDPSERYGSAAALGEDLRCFLDGRPVAAARGGRLYRVRKFVRRHRIPVAAATLALVSLVAGLALATAGLLEARRANRELGSARAATERESERLAAVNQFLLDTLAAATPDRAGPEVRVVDLLAPARARLAQLPASPSTRAALAATVGRLYLSLGLVEEAESVLGTALESSRHELGSNAVETFDLELQLASVWLEQERFEEVEKFLQPRVELAQELLGGSHPLALDLELVQVRALGWEDRERALERLRATVADREATLGPTHPAALDARQMLGAELTDSSAAAEAEQTLRTLITHLEAAEVQDRRQRLLSASTWRSIALEQLQRWNEAEALRREVLASLRAGAARPDEIATALNNLGAVLDVLGRRDEATAAFREALTELAGFADHPLRLTVESNLADALRTGGQLEDAAEAYRGVVERRARTLGPSHSQTLYTQIHLADTLSRLGRIDEARKVHAAIRKGLDDRGSRHFPWLRDYHEAHWAALLARTGDVSAEETIRAAMERVAANWGDHFAVSQALIDLLLESLDSRGASAEAAALRQRRNTAADPPLSN